MTVVASNISLGCQAARPKESPENAIEFLYKTQLKHHSNMSGVEHVMEKAASKGGRTLFVILMMIGTGFQILSSRDNALDEEVHREIQRRKFASEMIKELDRRLAALKIQLDEIASIEQPKRLERLAVAINDLRSPQPYHEMIAHPGDLSLSTLVYSRGYTRVDQTSRENFVACWQAAYDVESYWINPSNPERFEPALGAARQVLALCSKLT
jgi:hypothetical protein